MKTLLAACVLVIVSKLCFADQFPNTQALFVSLELDNVEAQRNARQKIKHILEDVFQRPVVLLDSYQAKVEIRLMTPMTGETPKHWYSARMMMDVIPAISVITNKHLDEGDKQITGVLRRPYILSDVENKYLLDDMTVAVNLLKNKRISFILDYKDQSAFYTQGNPELITTDLTQDTNIRILFSDFDMLRLFEDKIVNIPGIQRSLDNIIDDVSGDETMNPQQQAMELFLIAKQYDPQTNTVDVSDVDLTFTQWLREELPSLIFQQKSGNLNKAYETLASQSNVCIVNTYKSPKRADHATFSTPTYTYLDYKLYVRKGSNVEHQILARQRAGQPLVNLVDQLTDNPSGMVGYFDYLNRAKAYDNVFAPVLAAKPESFIQINTRDQRKGIELLKNSRIDYLVSFPFVMQQERVVDEFRGVFTSFNITGFGSPRPASLACSKTPFGGEVIDKLNDRLMDPAARERLITLSIADMIESDAILFSAAMHAAYQKQSAQSE